MRIRSDNRAQAIQVGAVLIFGLVIVVMASYQAFVVPSQSAEIEFNHHQEVERDMVALRAEILQAKTTGENRFTTVRLGTEFPSRIVAQNPPHPGGTLQTSENRTIQVDVDGDDMADLYDRFEPENRFIEYRPDYTEFREAGIVRYENTVVYQEFDDTVVFMSNQRLVQDSTVSLIPLHREYQESGRHAAGIEPIPGIIEREEVEDIEVTLGTALGQEEWREVMADEIADNDNLYEENVTVEDGILTLDLKGTFTLEYAPVGMDRVPFGGVRGDDTLEINPAAPGDIRLETEYRAGSDSEVKVVFNNTAETNNFTEARIAFYESAESAEQHTPTRAHITEGPTPAGTETTLEFRDAMKPLTENVELAGREETTVTLNFENADNSDPNLDSNSWFVLEFQLETGERATYFIAVPSKN